MVAFKANDANRIAKSPKSDFSGLLFYGSDAGQIAEYCRLAAGALSVKSSPPSDILKLSSEELAQQPGRLAVELRTTPMFGGKPVIWVRSGQNFQVTEIEDALGHGAPAGYLIVEAGNLPKTSKLRQFFEQRPDLAALPCFGEEQASISALITAQAAEAGIRVTPGAARLLNGMFAGNLALARNETAKLLLFARGEAELTEDLVAAAIGDVAESAAEDVITATLAGNTASALEQFARLTAANVSPQAFLSLLNYHLLRLLRIKTAMDAGETFAFACRRLRPPPHFRVEALLQVQCKTWPSIKLNAAVALAQDTIKKVRLNPAMEYALVERAILHLNPASLDVDARKFPAINLRQPTT